MISRLRVLFDPFFTIQGKACQIKKYDFGAKKSEYIMVGKIKHLC